MTEVRNLVHEGAGELVRLNESLQERVKVDEGQEEVFRVHET